METINTTTKITRDIYRNYREKNEPEFVHEEMIQDEPYTIFGSPTINTSISFALKVGGLKQIIKDFKLNGDDSLFITTSTDPNKCGISFIREKNGTNKKRLGDIIKYK